MQHNDEAFATMLLMSQIDPGKSELVRPLTTAEWHQLQAKLKASSLLSAGELLRADMGALMMLGCTEEESYRLCVLLGRTLPLSISLEQQHMKGIDIITHEERSYPDKLRDTLLEKAPPMLYIAGRPELFRQSAIAVLGPLAPKGDTENRVRRLVREASEAGFVVVLDGQNGLGHIALDEVSKCSGRCVLVLAGAMSAALERPLIANLVSERRCVLLSQFHPDAPYTASHAIMRNKCVYALSEAAFVFACDEDKGITYAGAIEALRAKSCKFVYALDTELYSGNRPLISKGAVPIPDLDQTPFRLLSENWLSATGEQTCLFDWQEPRRY